MPYTLPLGAEAPAFDLPGTDGARHRLADVAGHPWLVVFFTCNHCPYVTGSDELTRASALRVADRGVRFVGINSNSSSTYTEDGYPQMVQRMQQQRFPWLYLHDASQDAARVYGALRTPHFFLFDAQRRLVYTGRGVDSPRDARRVTMKDLDRALDDCLAGRPVAVPTTNPIGCNIKWDGKDPHWMPEEACDLV